MEGAGADISRPSKLIHILRRFTGSYSFLSGWRVFCFFCDGHRCHNWMRSPFPLPGREEKQKEYKKGLSPGKKERKSGAHLLSLSWRLVERMTHMDFVPNGLRRFVAYATPPVFIFVPAPGQGPAARLVYPAENVREAFSTSPEGMRMSWALIKLHSIIAESAGPKNIVSLIKSGHSPDFSFLSRKLSRPGGKSHFGKSSGQQRRWLA